MKLQIIGSGSSGNCYLLEIGVARVMIEAGLDYRDILKAIEFELPDVLLCSHEHKDHSKSVMKFSDSGVLTVCSDGTAGAIGIKEYWHSTKWERSGTRVYLLDDVIHDAVEPSRFVIDSAYTTERVLFITDTSYAGEQIDSVTTLMIEANWSEHTMGAILPHTERAIANHLSIEQACEYVREMDKSNLQNVYLLHLSNDNSDENYFKRKMQEVCGCPVYIAKEFQK